MNTQTKLRLRNFLACLTLSPWITALAKEKTQGVQTLIGDRHQDVVLETFGLYGQRYWQLVCFGKDAPGPDWKKHLRPALIPDFEHAQQLCPVWVRYLGRTQGDDIAEIALSDCDHKVFEALNSKYKWPSKSRQVSADSKTHENNVGYHHVP